MTYVGIILIIYGIICIALSYILSDSKKAKQAGAVNEENTHYELTQEDKSNIEKKINKIVEEEINRIKESTEASLDKISNTKILEMNEYADTVMAEINKNHNETVFLYDMLNEKAKEIKNTVKDVNMTKKEVRKMQSEMTYSNVDAVTEEKASNDIISTDSKAANTDKNKKNPQDDKGINDLKDEARVRLSELVKKSNESMKKRGTDKKSVHQAKGLEKIVKSDSANSDKIKETKVEFVKGTNNNQAILKLYEDGLSNKEIAKKLNLGIGEVKLVIDLYNNSAD